MKQLPMLTWLTLGILALGLSAQAAVETPKLRTVESLNKKTKPKWMLKSFLELSTRDPERLLSLGDRLFEADRMRITTIEPALAFEWQHRLAMVSALSNLFDSSTRAGRRLAAKHKVHARALIFRALMEDPSLLVRDGAAESVRRILRMQPGDRKLWKLPLEQAFLSPKNILDGEGFFVRETILTAMKEGGIRPSNRVRKSAAQDKNTGVKSMLRAWRTDVYDM